MSYEATVRKVISRLRARHPRFVPLNRRILLYSPVEHCSKFVYLSNRNRQGYFCVEWGINILCEPHTCPGISLGRTSGLVGRSTRFKPKGQGGLFEVNDPTIVEDFADQIEAVVLPIFDALDTFEKTVEFAMGLPLFPGGPALVWPAVMTAACGDIPGAQKLWRCRDTEQICWRVPGMAPGFGQFDEWCQFAEPLMDGDRAALAKLLHKWERGQVQMSKLERYWTSTPFPLEMMA